MTLKFILSTSTRQRFMLLASLLCLSLATWAQGKASSSDYLVANPIPANTIFYNYSGAGQLMPKIKWGLDQAWISDVNMKQGRNYLNLSNRNVDIVRISFQPCYALSSSGELTDNHKTDLDSRITNTKLLGYAPEIYINSDPKALTEGAEATVDSYYTPFTYSSRIQRWVNLMKKTGTYIENQSVNGEQLKVVCVAPYNEPDYSGWKQGTSGNMNSVCSTAKSDSWFSGKRLMAGNTLNADKALTWYNACKSNISEGNTHLLAGTFSNYIAFLKQVKSDSMQLCQDEMHNVMEAMVGANYGMNNGIWWGTAEHARAQFCRANDGTGYRLGYLENASASMAASIYRNTQDGVVEAYVGCAERTAVESSFGFVSKDRDVYYDGVGPTRAFYLHMPADPSGSYQSEKQKNAERVINIQSGADVQHAPVTGTWQLMNVFTGKVLTGDQTAWSGAQTTLQTGTGGEGQQWKIDAVAEDIGGDFSYYTIHQFVAWWEHYLDDKNWSFEEAEPVITYPNNGVGCEQWWFEYAGDGSFYIHNRYSNLVLDTQGNGVVQRTCTKSASQRWKLCAADINVDTQAPTAPTGLKATSLLAAIQLEWTGVTDSDLWGYTILRTEKGKDDWNTIARCVTGTTYIDNTTVQGVEYTYKIKAVDKCSNSSEFSSTTNASTSGAKGLVAHYEFDGTLSDKTANSMQCAKLGGSFSDESKSGSRALTLDGASYVQLPYQIANMKAMTLAGWVKWDGGSAWQRIFDFGNGEDEYMFLTPSNGSAARYEIKHNGTTQGITLSAAISTGKWVHVALTTETGKTCIYVDGQLSGTSTSITLLPSDLQSVCNYLGRSQYTADPMLAGSLDDVRIYNYALSAAEVAKVMGETEEGGGWAAGSSYYIYNVDAGQFLCAGNDWGTRASFSTTGLQWLVNDEGANAYSLSRTTSTSTYLFQDNAGAMFVDGASDKNRKLNIETDEETGMSYIRVSNAPNDTYMGWDGETANTIVVPQLPLTAHCTPGAKWMFMESAAYTQYRPVVEAALTVRQTVWPYVKAAKASGMECDEIALYENPATTAAQLTAALSTLKTKLANHYKESSEGTDVSYLMASPDCSSSTFSGWTTEGSWSSNTTYYRNGDALLSYRFTEKWTPSDNVLDNATLSQTLSQLPAGKYTLSLDAIVTNQKTRATITGATLYAVVDGKEVSTTCSTTSDSPLTFTTPTFTVGKDGKATVGFKLASTNASWVAFDNFCLRYYGPVYTLSDLTHLVGIMLGNETAKSLYDCNGDGAYDKADLEIIVQSLLKK